jgi:hypothetical protein
MRTTFVILYVCMHLSAAVPVHYWNGAAEMCGPQTLSARVTLRKTAVHMALLLQGPGFPTPHVLDYTKANASIGWTDGSTVHTVCSGLRRVTMCMHVAQCIAAC